MTGDFKGWEGKLWSTFTVRWRNKKEMVMCPVSQTSHIVFLLLREMLNHCHLFIKKHRLQSRYKKHTHSVDTFLQNEMLNIFLVFFLKQILCSFHYSCISSISHTVCSTQEGTFDHFHSVSFANRE